MGLDSLAEPMADDGPCGPDLNARMDPDFDAYYFAALGRLPDAYARPGVTRPDGSVSPDRVFDPGTLDLAGELRQIDALLERSRDLRLLALRVQWLALAGRVPARSVGLGMGDQCPKGGIWFPRGREGGLSHHVPVIPATP
ncbi:type VI secretion system ImpA family N-terminal domain-containing protein, partial [Rhodovulum sulfidophilum]|nr:type VI secretion system ImpA family N-terminal domain-containing protein [Rhodovulum sulfidophilum]